MSDEATTAAQPTPATESTPADVVLDPAAPGTLGRRNDRLLLWLVAGYIVLLSALMIVRGVSITPDVLLVALGLAAILLGRGRLFLRDWVPFIGLFFAYELMRGYADNLGLGVHVGDVLGIERWLFLGNVPTAVLQSWFHPAAGVDVLAVFATVFYFLHFPLPLAVGFFLWLRRRRVYYDFVAALIVLSMAGFVTYLLLPVAPPWYAAKEGLLPGVIYLKDQGFNDLARFFGFEGKYIYSYTIYNINPNQVAAFPSLHAGYPFLGFLFARQTFGRVGWLMIVYSVAVWFSIVYLADHYVVDILGGLAYAAAAYWAVIHAPGWFRGLVDRVADREIEEGVESAEAARSLRPQLGGRRMRPTLILQGAGLVLSGVALGYSMAALGALGGTGTALFLVPWFAVLGGLWRAAVGLLSR
jgi:hypothetical protein